MQPRDDENREPEKTPEPHEEAKPKLKRFRIVKLEERIAPRAGGNNGESSPTVWMSCW
jgi:hypothetical protein